MDYMKTEVDLPDPSCCRLTKYGQQTEHKGPVN